VGRTTELRREIRKRFFPFMTAKGFETNLRHAPQFFEFRKMVSDAIYLCDIQWDKRGTPRFILNFGKCGKSGAIAFGRLVSPDDVTSAHCSDRGRLHPVPGRTSWTTGNWFRQDRPLLSRLVSRSVLYPPEAVVDTLLSLFVEVEAYWENGIIGKHLRLFPPLGLETKIEPTGERQQ
jgi:hypothetical protein